MREKTRKLVYLNQGNYISYNFLKNFYWYIIIIPFFMVVMGVYLLNQNGMNGKSLFLLISIATWTILYWALVLLIKNKRIKKSFELRFLVNGTVGFLISSLMWIFLTGWNLIADKPFLEFDVFLWMIPIYMLVSVIYIASIVTGVHHGIYTRIKTKGKKIAFLSTSISLASGLGLIVSLMLRETASLKIQHIVITIGSVILIFVPILAHINFVQYFYCKKYDIKCDQNGNTTSPNLFPPEKETAKGKDQQENKIKHRTFVKVLLALIGVIATIFVVFCITCFIKGFIQGIS